MIISITNLKHAAFASHESTCFEATVSIDGMPAFHASNKGKGGMNRYLPIDRAETAQFHQNLDRVEAYAKALPPRTFHGAPCSYDLQLLICELVDRTIASRDLRRFFKTQVLFTKTDTPTDIFRVRGPLTPALRTWLEQTQRAAKILNDLPLEEAIRLYTTTP